MNKNAYEIRLDVLQMAHSDVFQRYHERVGAIKCNADKRNELYDESKCDSLYPKASEIITRANELYAFVEGK